LIIPQISARKFDYLKNYCLLESGILDRLEHDVRNLIGNIDEEKIKKVIEDLIANTEILTPEIINNALILSQIEDEKKKNVLLDIHYSIQILQNQINNPLEGFGKKSYAKVM